MCPDFRITFDMAETKKNEPNDALLYVLTPIGTTMTTANKNSRVEPSQAAEHDWMSQPDTRLIQALHETAPSPWEPSQTVPLEYPTSAVKRSVSRFHEQVCWQACALDELVVSMGIS